MTSSRQGHNAGGLGGGDAAEDISAAVSFASSSRCSASQRSQRAASELTSPVAVVVLPSAFNDVSCPCGGADEEVVEELFPPQPFFHTMELQP